MTPLPSTPEANATRIAQLLAPLVQSCAGYPVFLVDGDRTLTAADTSRTFLSLAGLDPLQSKARFQRDGYVFDAFRFHAKIYLNTHHFAAIAEEVAAGVVLYPGVPKFLRSAARLGRVFIVSAGIPRIWRAVLENLEIDGVKVIGGIDPETPYVFGRDEKTQVADLFRPHASRIIAIGDSDVDTGMLQCADHAVIAVNHKQNCDLLPHLSGHPSLWQVVPQGAAHPQIPVRDFAELPALAFHTSFHQKGEKSCR